MSTLSRLTSLPRPAPAGVIGQHFNTLFHAIWRALRNQGPQGQQRQQDAVMSNAANPLAEAANQRPFLDGLSAIYNFFRKNQRPVYFVSPTAYNVLGLDQWIHGLEYINHFDSFDGRHPRTLVPASVDAPEFTCMEDVVNHLLSQPVVRERVADQDGLLLTVMFDQQTEQLAQSLGLTLALPEARLRKRLDSKIVTTQLAAEAGVASVPNTLGRADSYAELTDLADKHQLGKKLVVQTPYGDSGRTTFFINNAADWDQHADDIRSQSLKVMKYINHLPGAVECVATRHGTLVGPMLSDITGFEALTPYPGGWCGNDVAKSLFTDAVRDKLTTMAKALGDRLYREGYKGTFCLDFLIDTDDGAVYLGEINPRISGVTSPTNLITTMYGGAPLLMFHLLEFMDVDYAIDIDAIQIRWQDHDSWSQLTFKQTDDEVKLIVKAPPSGIYRYNDGEAEFVRPALDWHNVADDNEFFFLRVYGVGEYTYKGADMGIIVSHRRMQSAERTLFPEAELWVKAIQHQFRYTSLPPLYTQSQQGLESSPYKLF